MEKILNAEAKEGGIKMSKKIVLDAGHGMNTPGKRCLKYIDANETREWVLNNRIVSKVQNKLKDYDVEVLRVDDPTGTTDISLAERINQANKFGADIYCSFHHNAGINGGTGGGIVVITYDNRSSLVDIRTKLYDKLIKATGLKGNRANPKCTDSNLYVLRNTNMNAVLVEHGFMDSTTDVPVILSEKFADNCANAWIEFFVEYLGIKKKNINKISYKHNVGENITISTYYKNPNDVIKKAIGANPMINTSIVGIVEGARNPYKTARGTYVNDGDIRSSAEIKANSVRYYPKYTGSSYKVDEVLRAIGVPEAYRGTWKKRKVVADKLNISNYEGSTEQNNKIISMAKQGKIPVI